MKKLFVLISLALAACGTIHQLGTKEPNRAVLSGPTNIVIHSVDGKSDLGQPFCTGPFCSSGFELGLAPAEHTIVLSYAGAASTKPGPIRYDFEAGKRYRLVVDQQPSYFRFKIEKDGQ